MVKKQDDKIVGAVLLTVVGVALLTFLVSSVVSFKVRLTPEEQTLVSFSPAIPALAVRLPVAVSGLSCPVTPAVKAAIAKPEASVPPASFPPGGPPVLGTYPPANALGETLALSMEKKPSVSLIMLDDGKRLALIDGKVVREGDRVNKATIARIEKSRILLKQGKGEQWLLLN